MLYASVNQNLIFKQKWHTELGCTAQEPLMSYMSSLLFWGTL